MKISPAGALPQPLSAPRRQTAQDVLIKVAAGPFFKQSSSIKIQMPKKVGVMEIGKVLKQGGVGVMPTDTLYGLVGSALRPDTVERIYRLRRRPAKKPFIVLISSLNNLKKFGAKVYPLLHRLWPGPVSIILPLDKRRAKKFAYLHRGKKAIAFRLPEPAWLRRLLRRTGPLVAPSANLAGRPPAQTINQAKKYFANRVDFYLAAGRRLRGQPSTLAKIDRHRLVVLRPGAGLPIKI